MLPPFSLFPAFLFLFRVHGYALPNPAAAAVTNPAAASTLSADFPDITDYSDFSTLPSSYYDIFTEYPSMDSAALASESAAYASATKQFYATAKPSDLAALSSYYRAESSAYAAWTSDLYQTLDASESAALASEYALFTKEEAVYATYTGTGTPFISGITNATEAVDAQVTSNGVVRDNSAGAATSTAPPVAQQSFGPLARSQSAPAAYGLTCLDSSGSQLDNHTVKFTDCAGTETSICDSLNDPANLLTDQWVWSNSGGSCAMGYWLPKVGTGTAAIPSKEECQLNIFDMMRRTCIAMDGSAGKWNAASVNVAVVPSANSNGQQVDSGRISYLMAGSPYPCGGQSCKMVSDA
ncbi:MAG: hypothetical protein Q9195_008305 [Heterodermia aff. obscurata]